MPEKEARPPAQNRHGGAPRGERVPLDARRASVGADRRAWQRDNRRLAPFGAPLAPHGADGKKETSKTRAQQRAAGTKKTALFDMVNRNDAATRLVSAERAKRRAVEARCLYAASRNVTRARSALSLRRRHAGKFTQPAQAWLRCRRLEGEGGLCPSCFETPRCARLLSMRARESSCRSRSRSTRPGHDSGAVAQPTTLAAAALLAVFAPASWVGESSASSARLIVAWRVAEVIFAPNRSVM